MRHEAARVRRGLPPPENEPPPSTEALGGTDGGVAEELKVFLHELSDLLDDVVATIQQLPVSGLDPGTVRNYVAAWGELEEQRAVEMITRDLDRPEIVERLPNAGLLGRQLQLKIEGWRRAIAEWFRALTARSLKAVLGWANVLLGSLNSVVTAPGLEMLREYKESTERLLDEAIPEGGFLPAPAAA